MAALSPVPATIDDVSRLRAIVQRAVEQADPVARAVTTLGADLPPADVRVVSRGEWIAANLASMRWLTDPHADRLLARSSFPSTVSRRAVAVQVGAIFGFLSTKVLGQYEVFLPGGATPGRLTLVGPNLLHTERQLAEDAEVEVDAEDLILGVVLHELGHRVQFEGVGWLRGHLEGMITRYLEETQLDPDRIRDGLRSLLDRLRQGGLELDHVIQAFLTPEQAAALTEAQAVMSLLEGHGNIVMDWGVEELDSTVDPARVRTALNARRNKSRGPSRVVAKALGLGMKAAQYATGERFIAAVAERHGRDVFHRVWEDPAHIPTPAELEDPDAWVARITAA